MRKPCLILSLEHLGNAHDIHRELLLSVTFKVNTSLAFPGGSVIKNPPANAGNMGSIPGSGRSHGEPSFLNKDFIADLIPFFAHGED